MLMLARHTVLLAILALCLSGTGRATEASATPAMAPKGVLAIVGGGLRADNAVVWQRIVDLAGGKGARIAVFGSAAGNPDRAARMAAERLAFHGAKTFVVPLAVRLEGSDYRAAADDPALAAAVAGANGAWFVGGDQARITQVLRKPDGSSTRMLAALWEMYRKGGVLAGTSAGAAVMSTTMFNDAPSVLATLQRGVADGAELAPGLGFIGSEVFVDQHLLVRGRFARMLPAMLAKGYKLGLGIDENTAMIVHPNREVEIVGNSGALLLDLRNASSVAGPANVGNALISYLDNGDRFNLATAAFSPSAAKADGRIDGTQPSHRGALFAADILGHSAIVELMTKLVDSDQVQAIGLAFGSPELAQGDLGFRFRISRIAESVAYASASGGPYSIYNIRLDVTPVKMRLPLYDVIAAPP